MPVFDFVFEVCYFWGNEAILNESLRYFIVSILFGGLCRKYLYFKD